MALWSSLSSMLKCGGGSAPAGAKLNGAAPGSVQKARTRARQRLIGALLLLTIGVIGFPLLFESRPRPIPIDIPIDIPSRDSAAPLAIPGAAGATGGARGSGSPAAAAPHQPAADGVITETPADAGRDVTPPATTAAARVPPAPVAVSPRAEASTARQPPDRTDPSASSADAARAQALLDGRPVARATAQPPGAAPTAAVGASASAAKPGEPRYIIQVGAFADPSAARETRMKVERLGLKTYTQVAETPAGARTRVRVGPFIARAEADKAMARVKAAGVAAAILTL